MVSNWLLVAVNSLNCSCSSESQIRALLISVVSVAEVSWYKYRIRSFWVKVFVIGNIIFDHFLSQVDQCIPHPSEGRVDAHAGAVRNFLEAHLQKVPHDQHLLLFFGQLFDQIA